MKKEKAYKLLALQEVISNSQAKALIDRGLVYVGNKKVMIARGEIDDRTTFRVEKIEKLKKIYEDDDILVIDKPAFVNSDEIEREVSKKSRDIRLLHRLDRETSGVLMLVKNEEFREKAIAEFRKDRVYKEYVAWVDSIVSEESIVDRPIVTTKKNGRAISNVASKGKPAITEIYPETVNGKKTKLKLIIHHGRTHQIRCHLRYAEFPIIGDELYGGRRAKRVMLHARKVKIFDYVFEAEEPSIFKHFAS